MCDSSISKLIDCQTPESAYTKVGLDGRDYKLVFSDEFNEDGRTFEEGADSYWEAADMHYYATQDLEYYDPSRITTEDGYLVIELIEAPDPEENHGHTYMSGMLSSWNKYVATAV
jgi:beta-glucanase (GH16 family)